MTCFSHLNLPSLLSLLVGSPNSSWAAIMLIIWFYTAHVPIPSGVRRILSARPHFLRLDVAGRRCSNTLKQHRLSMTSSCLAAIAITFLTKIYLRLRRVYCPFHISEDFDLLLKVMCLVPVCWSRSWRFAPRSCSVSYEDTFRYKLDRRPHDDFERSSNVG